MLKEICLIDNHEIIHDSTVWVKRNLAAYVKKIHSLEYEDYILKYHYNGIKPLCACGCKQSTKFHKGKYFKYLSDHKNKIQPTQSTINKSLKTKDNQTIDFKLKQLNIEKHTLFLSYQDFISYKINFTQLERQLCLDKRTIKKYWKLLGYISDVEEFSYIIKKQQSLISNSEALKKKIDENLLFDIYTFIRVNQKSFTLKEINDKFNLITSPLVLYKRLIENYSKQEIDDYLNYGNSSKPEIEYYNVLKYYFGNRINRNFKIQGKVYDYILDNKILIEFDGDYWHSIPKNVINDKTKDKIAINNGYIIFRIKESESKNINFLLQLNNLTNND